MNPALPLFFLFIMYGTHASLYYSLPADLLFLPKTCIPVFLFCILLHCCLVLLYLVIRRLFFSVPSVLSLVPLHPAVAREGKYKHHQSARDFYITEGMNFIV